MNGSVHLLTGAYAVDALDPAERAEFEAHLAQCPDCAAEVRGLLETASRLGSAEAVSPPARLKASVLAQVAATRQLPPAASGKSPSPAAAPFPVRVPAMADVGNSTDAPAAGSVVVAIARPGWSWAQRSLALAAAFLAFVAVSLSALLVQANHARSQVDATQQAVTGVLTAADARTLTGSITTGGKATIVVSPSQGTSVFLATGLPAAPAGHTYELWYLAAGNRAPVPAGTFDPDTAGHAVTVLTGTVSGATGIAVTVEAAGGSPVPTTKAVLAVQLPA